MAPISGFSNEATGWSYYLQMNGQRRFKSNSGTSSTDYGNVKYVPSQIIGVYVDMIDGYLAFSVEDKYLGPCYTIEDGSFDIS
jgi:hypothetical protein